MSDWSSDVCSSDLFKAAAVGAFAGYDDFFQLHLFGVLRRIGGVNPFGNESCGKQQGQVAEGGFLHFLNPF